MPMSQDEMASEYRAELESVVNNNKAQINLLTILAEDYAQASKEIVEAVEDVLFKAEPPVKILILYVIDSIVKNLPKVADYRDLFSKSIVKIFTHVFQETEPSKRAALYKLRLTWNDILPRNRLYAIDTKINAIDKNWPIASLSSALASSRTPPDSAAPTSSSKENFKQEPARTANPTTSNANQMVHVNPKFLNKNEAARMSGNSSDSGSSSSMSTVKRQPVVSIGGVQVADNGAKRLSAADSSENSSSGGPLKSVLKKPNTPVDPISKLTKVTAHANGTRVVSIVHADEPQKPNKEKLASLKEGELEKPVKRQRTPSTDNKIEPTTTTLTPPMAASEIEPKAKPERKSDKFKGDHKKKQKPDRKEKSFDNDKVKLEPMEVDDIEEITDTKPPPPKKALLNRIPKLSERQKQQKPFQYQSQPLPAKDHVVHHNYKPASQQHQNSQQQNFQTRQQQQHGQSPNANIQPTVALGSHAFVTTAVVNPAPVQMPPHSVATTFRQNMPASVPMPINTFPSALPPHSTGIPPPNFTPISMPPHAVSGPPPVHNGPPPMSVPPRDVNAPPPHVFFPPPSAAPLMMGNQPPIMPTVPPAAQAPVITNDTPRLSGVPLNNRIFVDGRAYEVFYLADTAVIERNGLPHRVSFNGPPRDVIIDGTAHRMAFGESKTVVIDGEAHVLRFGAPSRELYMGNFPFKGIFGGAPIVATINGRRHEIRLCGPAPEVKIEQDPSYDLTRHMPTVRQQSGFPTPPPKIAEKPKTENMDVTALLQKLQSTGVLTKFFPKATEAKRPENITSSSKHNKAHSPPIPSNQRLDNIQKMAAPMSSLDQFSMRSLVIRYDSVVAAIHQSRYTCGICGIGFKEMYTAAYQRHSEWHLKDMIDSRDHKYNRSRPWFMTEEWFTYSETEEANKRVPTDEKAGEDQTASGSGQNSGDALSEAITLKKCCICGENFEEYFDEDDDVWKLKDSEVEDGKAFHRSCKADAGKFQVVEEEPKESVGAQGLKFDSVILDQLINKTSSSIASSSVSPSTFVVVNNEEQGQQHPSDGLVAGTSLTQHFKQEL